MDRTLSISFNKTFLKIIHTYIYLTHTHTHTQTKVELKIWLQYKKRYTHGFFFDMKTNYTKLYKCQQGGMRVYTHACVCLLLCTHTYTYVYLHILFNSLFFAFFKSFLRHYLMDWTFAECQKFLLMLFLFCFSLIFFFSCIFSR